MYFCFLDISFGCSTWCYGAGSLELETDSCMMALHESPHSPGFGKGGNRCRGSYSYVAHFRSKSRLDRSSVVDGTN